MIKKITFILLGVVMWLVAGRMNAQVEIQLTSPADTFGIGENIILNIQLQVVEELDIESLELQVFDSLGLVKYLFPEDTSLQNLIAIPVDFEIADYGMLAETGTGVLQSKSGNVFKKEGELIKNQIQLKIWDPGYFMVLVGEISIINPKGDKTIFLPSTNHALLLYIKGPEATQEGDIEMRPIKDILREGWHWLDFKWLYIVLAALVLILVLINRPIKRRKKKEKQKIKEIIKRPAHEIANEKLEALNKAELWQKGEIKAFQTELSYIIREYLENRYDVKALESTTHEIIHDLEKESLEDTDIKHLSDLLQIADLVKFAKATPDKDIHGKFLMSVVDFVERTKFIKEEKTENK